VSNEKEILTCVGKGSIGMGTEHGAYVADALKCFSEIIIDILEDGRTIKQAGAVHEASLSKIMIHRVP